MMSNIQRVHRLGRPLLGLAVLAAIASAFDVSATVRYVDWNSANPTTPYTNWATAAIDIQDAIDVAADGDTVLVTNGMYGGDLGVNKPLKLCSVNGPQVTVIDGVGVLRCAAIADGASLSGFTLTNGVADYGAGVLCESTNAFLTNCVIVGNWVRFMGFGGGAYGGTLNNCMLSGNSARGSGGGAYGGTLNNCTLTGNGFESGGGASYCTLNNCTLRGNLADHPGGGAYKSTLNNCTLTGNWADGGGGAFFCTLNNCTLTGNATFTGGGAAYSTLNNCTLTGNRARDGGGAFYSTLNNCTLTGNSADGGGGGDGGAAYGCTLDNCILTDNLASYSGGGASGSTLNNCTLTRNSASLNGGGTYSAALTNCIVYYNTALSEANYDDYTMLDYCCTTPLPASGTGNITNAPLFLDYTGGNLRLQSNSPCINAGNNAYVIGTTDLDGKPRIIDGTVDMGAYEFVSNQAPNADASATLPLVISVNNTNATVVLDGSRSSDPDGDPLQYLWFEAGAADPLANGVVAVVTLPVGSNALTLGVSDGLATSSQTFAVEVITPAQVVERLVALVESGDPSPDPLIATLSAALAAIDRSNPTAAINQLQAFQNKVRAQVSPLDPELADGFIQASQQIIDSLIEGSKSPGKLEILSHQADGKTWLRFEAAPGALYIIEASTNLVDWEKIGVAKEIGAEVFEFEDEEATSILTRFYRIVSP